ncbi:unnamed protein product [Meganyctiphanes norvegica]|uniref:C-type lectin domain-containing protein n=1 Tax=Meganyctiphanes norvegica TaxID=48144 RepID=A0AAV2R081_MEGNR
MFLYIYLFYFVTALVKGDCPKLFTGIGENCYYFSVDNDEQHTWEQSREFCKNLGDLQEVTTDLAVFDFSGQTASEEDELMQAIAKREDVNAVINDRDVWIGAKINNEGGPFRWVQSNKELSYLYSHWHPDRPSTSSTITDCLTVWVYANKYNHAHKRGYFSDAPCNSARHFVCQVFE